MKQQPTFFGILPANVRYSKDLTDFQKLLYVEISALTQSNGYCYADNSYFAELYGKDVLTISRNITKLVKCGFLSREIKYKDNSKEVDSRFLRVVPIDKNINTPCQNNQEGTDKNINTPTDKNVKDNNTRYKQYKNNKKIYKKDSDIEVLPANDITKEVIGYLNQRANTNYKPLSKVNQQHINARLKEGFDLNDFKLVIDRKVKQWGSNPEMVAYLRPQTLFGTKMEAYLNEPQPKSRLDNIFGDI